jgi:small neutral amino acid transporter SnatA (MarC family)
MHRIYSRENMKIVVIIKISTAAFVLYICMSITEILTKQIGDCKLPVLDVKISLPVDEIYR